MSTPKAPAGLGAAGRKLWREILADFELPTDALSLLTAACRTIDELDKLHTAMAGAEVMTTGSQGQPVVNPLFAEARAHRATLAKLLAQLALPDEDDTPPLTATQQRAQKAAQARWEGYRQRYGDGASTA
ncbi:MAG: hypothetical protein ACRDTJ_30270 [Pseudonocardiaceae bacterium]